MLNPPQIGLQYLRFLTDDFGIWQHTNGSEIDHQMGYALDDAARALLVANRYQQSDLQKVYLQFITRACSKQPWVNFYNHNREPLPVIASEDALGQAYWATSECSLPEAPEVANQLSKAVPSFRSIRGQAYALLGACTHNPRLATALAEKIVKAHQQYAEPTWPWPEQTLTYANAIIPLSLLQVSQTLNEPRYRTIGLAQLNFLNQVYRESEIAWPVGNQGWYPKSQVKAAHDQQPIECAYLVLVNCTAFTLDPDPQYQKAALQFLEWFWGANSAHTPLIDALEGSCRDGISESGVSENRGAENVICYLLAQEASRFFL